MPQKLRFIWDEKNIDQELETFNLKTDIQGLTQTYFCGRFNHSVCIEDNEFEIISFIDFNFKHDMVFLQLNYSNFLAIQKYHDLTFTIITPGISRNAFCFCIIF